VLSAFRISGRPDLTPLIEFQNVTIVRNGRTALDDVSLTINRGENVAILGPNGCGKSTLVKAIARELHPYAGTGSVKIDGKDRWNLFELRKTLGMISNDLQALCEREATGLEVTISGFFGSYGVLQPYEITEDHREKAMNALRQINACHLADRRTDELSSGEGRRVLIARALVNNPQALLLDEPTTSLDLQAAGSLISSLRDIARKGTNLILVTHHIEEIVPAIKRVILLKKGRIFGDGATQDMLTHDALSDLFEAPIFVERHGGWHTARLMTK